MTKQATEQLVREKLLHRFSSALLQGDLDTVGDILKLAEVDAELETQLLEIGEALDRQCEDPAMEQDAQVVCGLLQAHLPQTEPAEADEVPALTVGEVVNQLHLKREVPNIDREASEPLRRSQIQIPTLLGKRALKKLAYELQIALSDRFWQLFRDAAIMMGLRASRQISYIAARKQRPQRQADVSSARKDKEGVK